MRSRSLVIACAALFAGGFACDAGGAEQGRETAGSALAPAASSATNETCKASGALMRLADLPEASGLAVSRASGRFWAHNDSGAPILFALDENGKTSARVTVEGAAIDDWEALAIGPCPAGSCLYIADIGDNDARRAHVTIYRVPEPAQPGGSAKVSDIFQAAYPDGAHDAEALLVAPDGGLFIVTKGDTGHVALYKFPRELKANTTLRLERVGEPLDPKPAESDRITDGAISPDGKWVALRSKASLRFYPAGEFLRGTFKEARRMDLRSLGEPQGEAVAFGSGDTVYVAGEGGGKKQPGTLAALTCAK